MAIMFPSDIAFINENSTPGERKVFDILKKALPNEYTVYYHLDVDGQSDYTIIGPSLGIVVIEVKDWSIDYIVETTKDTYKLKDGKIHKNPIKQAREYSENIAKKLQKNQSLRETEGPWIGNLKLVYGYGVVFVNIACEEFSRSGYSHSIDNF